MSIEAQHHTAAPRQLN